MQLDAHTPFYVPEDGDVASQRMTKYVTPLDALRCPSGKP